MAKIKLEIISPNKVVYSADYAKTCSTTCRACSSCYESYD